MSALLVRLFAAATLLAAAERALASPTAVAPLFDSSPSALCESAIARASAKEDVPERLLRAVALVESGRTRDGERRPWPWTVNMEGESRWFETRAEAVDFVLKRQRAGARSFDIGCMQLNHIWHGEGFRDIDEMFDPSANVAYAARFLSQLKAETGEWMRAAGYYHSRTPEHFERYSGLIAAAYEASKSKPRPAEALRETVVAASLPATASPDGATIRKSEESRREVQDALWNGLLRKTRAPARSANGQHLALFVSAEPTRRAPKAPDDPETTARPRAGAVSLSGLGGGGGGSLLRPAKPMF